MSTNNGDSAQAPEQPASKKAKKKTPIGDFESIEDFAKTGLAELMEATKGVNSFPQGSARDLYCAYPTFGRLVDQQSHKILGLMSKVLKWQNVKGNIQRRQQDEQFEMLLECNDAIMERLNSNLDEMAGIKKNPQTVVVETRLNTSASEYATAGDIGRGAGSWNLKKNEGSPMTARLITAKNIARPQIKFQIPVDNSASTPFVPKIKEKPNSIKPLAILPEYDDVGNIVSYLHPYELELMKFEVPKSQLAQLTAQKPQDIAKTDLVFVETTEKLVAALQELRQAKCLAIDVEHHSYRTFLGFTCLVQISSKQKDYLFDALALREEMHILNEIFTDPKIVKILHGADSDIEWLQRDLSLYIVNMFDTHQAAKALNFARLSLSYLLKHYCDIEADKTFQLADWRIRPLPKELIDYARQDTHFLIYIFEMLTNDLLEAGHQQTNLLNTIYQRSTELCKKRYAKPAAVAADSHLELFRKSKRIFDNRQLCALRDIYRWRDIVARQEDESYGYVLPNHMMLQIAESLPREMQGVLACCNPIPPLVRQHLHTLHQIVLKARDQPLVKPILQTDTISRVAISSVKDYNSKLYCPHDLSHVDEFRDDLPTLLNPDKPNEFNKTGKEMIPINIKMSEPVLSFYKTTKQTIREETLRQEHERLQNRHYIISFKRFLAVLPIAEKEKLEEATRMEAENKKRQLCPAAPSLSMREEIFDEIKIKQENDNEYSVPIKELLKRKYEESVAAKAKMNTDAPTPKRIKTEQQPSNTAINVTPSDNKLKFVNLPPTKKELKQQQQQQQNHSKPTQQQQQAASSQEMVNVEDTDSDGPPQEMPSTSQANQKHINSQQQQRNKKQKFKNKQKFKHKQLAAQSSNRPVNFDYKQVDFKKFQGGAQRAKGLEIKHQVHGKGNNNKANNKKFNKLFTFSNVKSKK